MIKNFELWLDESGKFTGDSHIKNRKIFNASLVGGILIEKDQADRIDFNELLGEGNHACELTPELKREYVVPVLEKMRDNYKAKEVFFENSTYEEGDDNRSFYLRIIAEGIIRLVEKLNAQYESVNIDILIAQRQDITAPIGHKRIISSEYVQTINRYINRKKFENNIIFDRNTRISFNTGVAVVEDKLIVADFACNTRLIRTSEVFESMVSRVKGLHNEEYIFALSEDNIENSIIKKLSAGNVSTAIIEVFTEDTSSKIFKHCISIIVKRLKEGSYRIAKSELRSLASDIVAYAANEDDYEVGEALFKRLDKVLFPRLEAAKLPCGQAHFQMLLYLADMYLREGDIVEARKVINKLEVVQTNLGDNLEEVFSYYQLLEKQSLLLIDEFCYEEASQLMEKACGIFERLIENLIVEPGLAGRFNVLSSEYYGDALCMEIYAKMFLQRSNPDIYDELCKKSDIALKQYPDYEGELERHRQYRSHIEAEAGNFESAILYLFKANEYYEENITANTLKNFLNKVYNKEVVISCRYYLSYYLFIMAEAMRAKDPLAEMMYTALCSQRTLLEMMDITVPGRRRAVNNNTEIVLAAVKERASGLNYHPMEVIYQKIGEFFLYKGQIVAAINFFEKAKKLTAIDNYATMRITGIQIAAFDIAATMTINPRSAVIKKITKLNNDINRVLRLPLTEKTKDFVREYQTAYAEAIDKEEWNREDFIKIARKSTY